MHRPNEIKLEIMELGSEYRTPFWDSFRSEVLDLDKCQSKQINWILENGRGDLDLQRQYKALEEGAVAQAIAEGYGYHGYEIVFFPVSAKYADRLIDKKVKRGPDWNWEPTQEVGVGTIISVNRGSGWVTVRWEDGSQNGYRIGSEGKYDLRYLNGRVVGK